MEAGRRLCDRKNDKQSVNESSDAGDDALCFDLTFGSNDFERSKLLIHDFCLLKLTGRVSISAFITVP